MNTKKKRSKNKRITKGKGRLKVDTIYRDGRTINRVTAPQDPKVKDSSSSKRKKLKERAKIKTRKLLKKFIPKRFIPKQLKLSSSSNKLVFKKLEKNTQNLFEEFHGVFSRNTPPSPLTPLTKQLEKLKIGIRK